MTQGTSTDCYLDYNYHHTARPQSLKCIVGSLPPSVYFDKAESYNKKDISFTMNNVMDTVLPTSSNGVSHTVQEPSSLLPQDVSAPTLFPAGSSNMIQNDVEGDNLLMQNHQTSKLSPQKFIHQQSLSSSSSQVIIIMWRLNIYIYTRNAINHELKPVR